MVNPAGERVEASTIKIIPTPRRGVTPCVALTPEMMTWIKKVGDMPFEIETPAEPRCVPATSFYDEMDLPPLESPMKWRKRGKALSIARDYVDKDGNSKTVQRTVTHMQLDADAISLMIPTVIKNLDTFVQNHGQDSS